MEDLILDPESDEALPHQSIPYWWAQDSSSKYQILEDAAEYQPLLSLNLVLPSTFEGASKLPIPWQHTSINNQYFYKYMYILNFILKDSPVWARKAGKDKGKHGNSSLLPEIHADVGGEEKQYPLTIKCTSWKFIHIHNN